MERSRIKKAGRTGRRPGSSRRAKTPPAPALPPNRPGRAFAPAPLLLGGGFLLASWSFLAVRPFHELIPYLPAPSPSTAVVMGFLGFFAMAAGFFGLPKDGTLPEMDRKSAWLGLAAVFLLAYLMRLTRMDQPLATFWDETADGIHHTSRYLALDGYRHGLFPGRFESAIFHAWSAGLWALFPDAPGMTIQRVSGSLLDLIAVWLMYLLGREVGGRRTGLILALLGAVSKPMLRECLRTVEVTTVPIVTAWILLATARLVHKPVLRRYLVWAVSLAFLLYGYTACRHLVPFFLSAVWVWTMAQTENRRMDPLSWTLSVSALGTWLWAFGAESSILPPPTGALSFLTSSWFLLALAGAGIWLFVRLLRIARATGTGRGLACWIPAAGLAWFLMTPLIQDPNFGNRISDQFRNAVSGASGLDFLVGKARTSLSALFLGRSEYGDSFYEFQIAGLSVLALAWLVAKPSRTGLWYLIAAGAGLAAYILTVPNDGRATPSVVAWLTCIAAALAWMLARLGRRGALIALAAIGLWAGWSAWSTYHFMYDTWQGRDSIHHLAARVLRERSMTHRTYVGGGPGFTSLNVLNILGEGSTAFGLQEHNTIGVRAGEHPPDVAVLLSTVDQVTADKIRRQYPGAEWSEHRLEGRGPEERPDMLEARIPSRHLRTSESDLFTLRPVAEGGWIRRLHFGTYGFGRGLYQGEDVVPDLSGAPLTGHGQVVRLFGRWTAPTAGRYHFSIETGNYVLLRIDGRKILDLRPSNPTRRTTSKAELEAGEHPIEILVFYRAGAQDPHIEVRGPGSGKPVRLGGWIP